MSRQSGSSEALLLDALSAKPDATPTSADAVVRGFTGTLLYCHAAENWFVWDGTIWRRDRGGAVRRMIHAGLRATGIDDPAPGLIAGIERWARSEPTLVAEATVPRPNDEAWDANPWRLGTPGGTVDLTTGVLKPADPIDRITRLTAVAPAEAADCPIWRRFLDETMGGDAALIAFLQRFLGYALTGETCEHALLYGLGEGGNGKSVFVNCVRGLFGDYAAVAAPDLFAQGGARGAGKTQPAEIAMLAGARLVTASETEEGRVWADGRLKLLTGGDPVTARFLKRDPFTFTPRFKLIIVGNHMPLLRTVDAAIRRRLCLVPFATRPAVPDRRLEAKLRAEWPAILRWMIDGCLAWQAQGLDGQGLDGQMFGTEGSDGKRSNGVPGGGRPASVIAATDAYLGSQDIVGQFLADWCDRSLPHFIETAGELYAAWCAYAKSIGEPPGTQRRLAAALDRHGLTRQRLNHARIYRGIRLVRPGERDAEVYEARRAGG